MIGPKEYKATPSGTHYRLGTPDELVATLERLRVNRVRVAVVYEGDSVVEFGRVGRSCGPTLRVPVLLHGLRSPTPGEIHTTCVREVRTEDGERVLYAAARGS
jgi:hypothetical protein